MPTDAGSLLLGAAIALASSIAATILALYVQSRLAERQRLWSLEDHSRSLATEIAQQRAEQAEAWARSIVDQRAEAHCRINYAATSGMDPGLSLLGQWLRDCVSNPPENPANKGSISYFSDAELLKVIADMGSCFLETVSEAQDLWQRPSEVDSQALTQRLNVLDLKMTTLHAAFLRRLDALRVQPGRSATKA
jgi:hypothetical protein